MDKFFGNSNNATHKAKLNIEIKNLENYRNNIYMEIGRKVHEIYLYGGTLGNYFDDKYLDIINCENRINSAFDTISRIDGYKICFNCKKKNAENALSCVKCGSELKKYKQINKNISQNSDIINDVRDHTADSEKQCRNCGYINSPFEKYCLKCGKKI